MADLARQTGSGGLTVSSSSRERELTGIEKAAR
ncbi:hypothetical protein A6302_02621 [Methylobrevis pamukkalensis]|uniref:Uncharacterized protein n=1 Tax=Methylobrevis pamukkalensis TaxID=1439726 RepID=A0A1E3H3G4_9HYPH|nr:hypothetical protein A6302_02621 [Methylobrevis pamukkalensis]